MTDPDVLARRLGARGYYEITPASGGVHIVWVPRGQGGPGGCHRINPFCARSWTGPLTEVLEKAVAATEPEYRSLEEAWLCPACLDGGTSCTTPGCWRRTHR